MTAAALPGPDHAGSARPARPTLTVVSGGPRARVLLDPGTQVTVPLGGQVRYGVVQCYEQRWSQGTFPVRLDDGQWRLLTADDVTVLP